MTKEQIFQEAAHKMAAHHLEEYQLDRIIEHNIEIENVPIYLKGFDDGFAKAMLLIFDGTISIQCIKRELNNGSKKENPKKSGR